MRSRRGGSPVRGALLLAVALAVGVLAIVIAADPRRIGIFQEHPGRTAAPGEAGWARAAPAPIALTEVAAAAHQGRIWVAGGLDEAGRAVDHLQVYDPVGDAWAQWPPLPEPLHHSALVSDGDGLFLIGGYTGNGFDRPTAAVWRLDDADAGVWTAAAPLPEPRAAGAAAWSGRGSILYGGGVGPTGVSAEVFSLESGEWRALTSLSRPREHLAASSGGAGSVAFLGGRDAGGNLGTVDVVTTTGEIRPGLDLPTPRGGVAAFAAGALGDCVAGGEGPNGTFADVECVAESGTTTLPGLSAPRHGLGAAVFAGRAYVLLGGPRPGLTVSPVVEVLDLR